MPKNTQYTGSRGADARSAPLVSIVTATYNRSNVLALAIETVRRQTITDWELIVVGDACTDDTGAVVAGFSDPRLTFENLPRNSGEQSGPNNAGVALARGRFLAFLNHDDLWLPDHLERALAALESGRADLVFTLAEVWEPDGRRWLTGTSPTGRYEPTVFVPASTWVMRRELAERVGPWRASRECYSVPSQDWLYRAKRAGARLEMAPAMTVVAIQSGTRPGSYARREDAEHRDAARRIVAEPDFRETELGRVALCYGQRVLDPHVTPFVAQAARNVVKRLALAFGQDPNVIRNALYHGRRGAFVRRLRRRRGLPATPRNEESTV